ncbi:hypothetical protein WMY93_017012 [Mugilogobius chulae]|uniref:Receptor ligand binding region domain-containing protein n=1 Tax=Mugilogobius chulae TaxID=88201 RepID=A0AAW0NX55_9GOBI
MCEQWFPATTGECSDGTLDPCRWSSPTIFFTDFCKFYMDLELSLRKVSPPPQTTRTHPDLWSLCRAVLCQGHCNYCSGFRLEAHLRDQRRTVLWKDERETSLCDEKSTFFQFGAALQQEALLMLAIMEEYDWHVFSIVTSKFPGYQDFISTLRITVDHSFVRWDLQSVVTLDAVDGDPNSKYILEEARSLGLVGAGYIWIVSSLTTGNPDFTPEVGPYAGTGGGHSPLSFSSPQTDKSLISAQRRQGGLARTLYTEWGKCLRRI